MNFAGVQGSLSLRRQHAGRIVTMKERSVNGQ
jgi:hypothetical protein